MKREDAIKVMTNNLNELSSKCCGSVIAIIDLGKVNSSCKSLLLNALQNAPDNYGSPIYHRVIEKIIAVENNCKAHSINLPYDESAYNFCMVECTDGIIGITINTPSPKSHIHGHNTPMMLLYNDEQREAFIKDESNEVLNNYVSSPTEFKKMWFKHILK
jgi:hypothetical protein